MILKGGKRKELVPEITFILKKEKKIKSEIKILQLWNMGGYLPFSFYDWWAAWKGINKPWISSVIFSFLLTIEQGFNIMGFILFCWLQPKAYLGLINTLFLAWIHGLFGLGYGLFSLGFFGSFL
jgi:hypothetical protein